ncbi:MAG: hypothetical protein KDB27_30195, partial [Planctomycetales bacterium]|nr:hypothetical protein [Planctomycetales bacterium]
RGLLGIISPATSIPVEADGGAGTADAHWDEVAFDTELMTGFVEGAGVAMPLSRMTVGSLDDIGYGVNYAAADSYSVPLRVFQPVIGIGGNIVDGRGGLRQEAEPDAEPQKQRPRELRAEFVDRWALDELLANRQNGRAKLQVGAIDRAFEDLLS